VFIKILPVIAVPNICREWEWYVYFIIFRAILIV